MVYPDTIAELRALIDDLQSCVMVLEWRIAKLEAGNAGAAAAGDQTTAVATNLTVLSPLVDGGVANVPSSRCDRSKASDGAVEPEGA